MRPRIIWTIFRKEITETLRDRRTLLMMVGLPLLLYPLMIIGLSKLGESQEEAREARISKVGVWGEWPPGLIEALDKSGSLSFEGWAGVSDSLKKALQAGKLKPFPAMTNPGAVTKWAKARKPSLQEAEAENPVLAEARALISSRKLDGVLVLWPGTISALTEGRLAAITIYFDSVREDSQKARERLVEGLIDFRRDLIQQREQDRGLARGFSTAIEILPRNVAPASRRSGQMMGSLLPFLLIIVSASACLYAAIDLTAGEKERNTLQTLLCAPVLSQEIILGKFLTVWAVALLATLVNLLSMAATFARLMIPGGQLSTAPSTYLVAFLMLLPVTFTVTAVFLAVAVFAKDFKDGQNFLTPVLMLLMLPLGATMIPGIELNAWTAFVPIVNIALLIKALFLGEAHGETVFLTLASSAAYGMLTLLFAARVFQREQVLLGGKESLRVLLGLKREDGAIPTPSLVLTLFGTVFVLAFYGSLFLRNASVTWMILATEFGFFLLPTLAIALAKGFSLRKTFALRPPPWKGILAGSLMGLSAWAFVGGLLIRLLPPPESLIRAMEKIFLLDEKSVPLWTVWLVLAVSPALCEEVLFRGMILTGFRRLGMWPAVTLSGLLFGLAHSSIYRLLPTFFLGALFGYLVWRTGSVYCSMAAHALNNGMAMTLLHHKSLSLFLGIQGVRYLPWGLTLAGTAVMLFSIWLVSSLTLHNRNPFLGSNDLHCPGGARLS
jgi:sodium transport system permease protein